MNYVLIGLLRHIKYVFNKPYIFENFKTQSHTQYQLLKIVKG